MMPVADPEYSKKQHVRLVVWLSDATLGRDIIRHISSFLPTEHQLGSFRRISHGIYNALPETLQSEPQFFVQYTNVQGHHQDLGLFTWSALPRFLREIELGKVAISAPAYTEDFELSYLTFFYAPQNRVLPQPVRFVQNGRGAIPYLLQSAPLDVSSRTIIQLRTAQNHFAGPEYFDSPKEFMISTINPRGGWFQNKMTAESAQLILARFYDSFLQHRAAERVRQQEAALAHRRFSVGICSLVGDFLP